MRANIPVSIPDIFRLSHRNLGRSACDYVMLGLVFIFTSCGPVYQDQYTYLPPESPEGRSCIFQCENSKQSCQQLEEMNYQHCEERSRWERERCERKNERKGKKEKWYDCWGSSCSKNLERCDSMYVSCYRSCGGTVNVTNVCVSGCEQAAK